MSFFTTSLKRRTPFSPLLFLTATLLCVITIVVISTVLRFAVLPPHIIGGDFQVFYAAGLLIRHGQNPYNVLAIEKTLNNINSYMVYSHSASFVDAPWFGVLMALISFIPFWLAYGLWTIVLVLIVALSAYWWSRALQWTHPFYPALGASLSTIALVNYDLGQIAALAFGLLTAVFLFLRAQKLFWAGFTTVASALLLPQDLWLLVPLTIFATLLLYPSLWPKLLAGQVCSALFFLGAPLVIRPNFDILWFSSLLHFGAGPENHIKLIGLAEITVLFPAMGTIFKGSINPLTVIIAVLSLLLIVLFVRYYLRHPALSSLSSLQQTGWLLLFPLSLWLLASPYGHVQDLITLFPLVFLSLGKNAHQLFSWKGGALLLSILFLPVALTLFGGGPFPTYNLSPFGLLGLIIVSWLVLQSELRSNKPPPLPEPIVTTTLSL